MKPLRIHYFQHVPFEGLGSIEKWAIKNNHYLTATKFFQDFALPKFSSFDWLIVMGGPMGVYNEQEFPRLKNEIDFIRQAIQANKTVVGICLGSQLIAAALGAKVYPNAKKEIGWFPITKTKTGQQHQFLQELPTNFTTFHWHGDTFDLPTDSKHLLQTEACLNQAFIYKDKVLGLQFHLEVTPQTLKEMIINCRQELIPSDYIKSEREILSKTVYCIHSNNYLESILNKLMLINKS